MKHYTINEIFFSIQGEGVRQGTPNVFVRFSGCNLTCDGRVEGEAYQPVCDTEFVSGRKMTLDEIADEIKQVGQECKWLVLTGGEPGLQMDREFIDDFHAAGYSMAVETNGTIKLPDGLDWVTVSPKIAEHAIKQTRANEVKYVRAHGQGIPKTQVQASYKLISPAFEPYGLEQRNLFWCLDLVRHNPDWRLSVQLHKFLRLR